MSRPGGASVCPRAHLRALADDKIPHIEALRGSSALDFNPSSTCTVVGNHRVDHEACGLEDDRSRERQLDL
jgi:hypothetical protein